ncbi:nucleotidyltransferase domain-containing protein [Synechococcus sp. CBW1107]|uniref:nucleotidyltransferase family protein n=1 Tax=Synechococcus sp. CBW1107 TaxID=2789857 RepID=UPI002AD5B279|nr:nucleotidyltransferase domain-containing protein [Synechococcus sp. CBW1107]
MEVPAAMAAPVWLEAAPLRLDGLGLYPERLRAAFQALADDPATKALVLFGSRARGEARPGSDLDLLLLCRGSNSPDALLSGSRWHVLGRIAREGKVLYAA